MLCPWGRTSRIFYLRENAWQKYAKRNEIQLSDWSTPRNLSNRSSGVQIPRDICTRFGRYLYSTRCSWVISNSNWTKWSTIQGVIAQVISKSDEHKAQGQLKITSTITPFIKSILKSLVVSVIWLAKIGAIYSQIAPFFALNHIIFPANEEVTFQTCGLSWRFRERLRYTVELSSNQK